MTGQGSTQHEFIKKGRAPLHPININKDYRTQAGHRVRGLRYSYTNHKTKDGQTIVSASVRKIILGDVYMRDVLDNDHFNWIHQVWEIDGTHQLSEQLDLQEYKEAKVPQPTLF